MKPFHQNATNKKGQKPFYPSETDSAKIEALKSLGLEIGKEYSLHKLPSHRNYRYPIIDGERCEITLEFTTVYELETHGTLRVKTRRGHTHYVKITQLRET